MAISVPALSENVQRISSQYKLSPLHGELPQYHWFSKNPTSGYGDKFDPKPPHSFATATKPVYMEYWKRTFTASSTIKNKMDRRAIKHRLLFEFTSFFI